MILTEFKGKHDLAKEHIMMSIILLQDEFLSVTMPKRNDQSDVHSQKGKEGSEVELTKSLQDRIAVLAIAYHNLGVEYEFLKKVKLKLFSHD